MPILEHTPTMRFIPGVRAPAANGLARWYLYQGDRLIVDEHNGAPSIPVAETPQELGLAAVCTEYLGMLEGERPLLCFSGCVADEATLPNGFAAYDLRALFEQMDEFEIGLAGRAKQIAHWDRDHQFCGRCGAQTELLTEERARRCPRCRLTSYPRISPAIIVAVTRRFDDGPRILLARNHRFPPGRYSVIAGFVEAGETLEDCVRREVEEETGVQVDNIRYFGSQPWPFPNSLMIGFTAEHAGGEIVVGAGEIADAQWFAPDALPLLPPKISIARRLIDDFVARCHL
ncbi:NAD(+) diphosphatase [Caldilinea sp.]|uniref:NAD(+) diphosphatase n=1 Tax=Caldilinea sp. TaxID=2293560 RepID=UPI00261DB9C1|nr:NAD(+) diphosphatase [uncultured Caldilinea sp.]